jgi:hypothetical protein
LNKCGGTLRSEARKLSEMFQAKPTFRNSTVDVLELFLSSSNRSS